MNGEGDIVICMGSSCFTRGNRQLLPLIEQFLKARGLGETVGLSGSHCEESCADGPTIYVQGTRYQHMDAGVLLDVLERHFPKNQEA